MQEGANMARKPTSAMCFLGSAQPRCFRHPHRRQSLGSRSSRPAASADNRRPRHQTLRKIRQFVADLIKVGESLRVARCQLPECDETNSSTGPANLVRQTEMLKKARHPHQQSNCRQGWLDCRRTPTLKKQMSFRWRLALKRRNG